MTAPRYSQLLRIVPILLLVCLLTFPARAQYSGGTGEPNDPYQIATAADLIALGETPEDYDKHFIVTADIDLDPALPGRKVFDRAVIAPDTDPVKSGFQGTAFTGVFDGIGNTILRLMIVGGGYLGLFGQLGSAASVCGLGMQAVTISGSGSCVGSLAGSNVGSIAASYSISSIDGGSSVGGLVGGNRGGDVKRCYCISSVMGNDNVGGLIGDHTGGAIETCYAAGCVTGSGSVGGLVGLNDSALMNSYSLSIVSGNNRVGGLIGKNSSAVYRCYSTGAVNGKQYVGGLVGSSVFTSGSEIIASFWGVESSGSSKMCGIGSSDSSFGRTTAEMQTAITFLGAGWDFVGETANGSEDIWKIPEGECCPRLWWEKYSGGTGKPNDPYQIALAADLIALGGTPEDYDKHFILTADIDLDPNLPGRKVFDRAVVAPGTNDEGASFAGVFDGRGHTLRNLTIVGEHFLGLFGRLGPTASVSNLGLEAVAVSGTGWYIGGLVGSNSQGSIAASYSTGSVSGGSSVGGLVGCNSDGGVTTSYSTASVSGDGYVGGLVGFSSGGIVHSYSAGSVNGNRNVGGLVGSDYGDIAASFWDTETSGQVHTPWSLGTGKTTAAMQMAKTFLDAGWDFVGETDNGTEDIWWILEGLDYPRLWWEVVKNE